MAPILSKPATKSHENAWFAILCGKIVEQAKEVARDLVEVTNYLKKCMTFDTQLQMVSASFSQFLGCWTLMSLHNLICQFTDGRAKRQSSKEEPEIKRMRLVDFMPPAFIAWIIGILYSSFVFVYLPCAGLSLVSPVSLAFHAMIAMVLTTYYKAAVTDPGTIPASITWRTFGRPPASLKDRKKSGEARWCRKSEAYKPDRSHYCSATERCVLRMDHYCPWLNNTVGYANHKFFLQFLVYSSSACLLGSIKTVQLLASVSLPPTLVLMLVEAGAIGTLLSGILIPFTTFHCWLLCNNMTTIEFCASFAKTPDEKPYENPYDVGIYRNLCSVLGSSPLVWWAPVGGPAGDGISFPRRGLPEYYMLSDEEDPEAAHPAGPSEEGSDAGREVEVREGPCSFFVWVDAAEFTDDLKVGCEVILETAEDAALSAWHMLSQCRGRKRKSSRLQARSEQRVVRLHEDSENSKSEGEAFFG
mmetsp:Transcript_68396/g.163034  ORF Transcript_68396/g.163034 Transcript_68396/m.163034 type:complete len:473 (-) Transcript_68396:64-1482(-)